MTLHANGGRRKNERAWLYDKNTAHQQAKWVQYAVEMRYNVQLRKINFGTRHGLGFIIRPFQSFVILTPHCTPSAISILSARTRKEVPHKGMFFLVLLQILWKAFAGCFYGTVVSGFTVCKDLTVGRPTTHSSNSPKIEHNRNPPTPSSKTLQQGSSLHSPMFFCPTFAPLPDWMKPRCQLWKVGKCPFSQHVEHDCFVILKSQSWPVYHPSLPTLPQANQHGWLQRHIPKVQSKTKTVMHNGKMHHTCQRPGVHVQQQQFYASCSSIRSTLVFDRMVCV